MNQQATPARMSRRMRREVERQGKRFSQLLQKQHAAHNRTNSRLNNQLKQLSRGLDKETLGLFVKAATVEVGEGDEKTTRVNIRSLISELRNLSALNREERIQRGLRKRTTGRASDRKRHSATMEFIVKRNEQLKAQQVINDMADSAENSSELPSEIVDQEPALLQAQAEASPESNG